jgi:hypothetical protein
VDIKLTYAQSILNFHSYQFLSSFVPLL